MRSRIYDTHLRYEKTSTNKEKGIHAQSVLTRRDSTPSTPWALKNFKNGTGCHKKCERKIRKKEQQKHEKIYIFHHTTRLRWS